MRWFGWFRRKRARSGADDAVASIATAYGRSRTVGIPYVLPNDLEEMNRLDFQHYLLRQAFHGNYAAPITYPMSILDVGSGTGRWAREMATIFPDANVIGVDVNEPPTDEAAEQGQGPELRPTNYSFVAANVFEGLPFPDESFDFVHMRLLVLAVPHDRWPTLISELVRVTRPGGWVESVEATTLEQGGPAMDLFMSWIVTMLARRNIDFDDGSRVAPLLSAAGLVNVVNHKITLPFGEYGGRVGKLLMTDFFNGVMAYGGMMEAQGIATIEQFQQVVTQARIDAESPQTRCVSPFYIAFGQRPR